MNQVRARVKVFHPKYLIIFTGTPRAFSYGYKQKIVYDFICKKKVAGCSQLLRDEFYKPLTVFILSC